MLVCHALYILLNETYYFGLQLVDTTLRWSSLHEHLPLLMRYKYIDSNLEGPCHSTIDHAERPMAGPENRPLDARTSSQGDLRYS